jgi:pimeloyl-ACP methyl ester carboxylesterase
VSTSGSFAEVHFATGRDGRLAYQVMGESGGVPLLLVAGLGAQMVYWRDELVQAFIEAGFRVARFDNRDAGLSFHLGGREPGRLATVLRPASVARYRLDDLADDAVAVLDALEWPAAVVLGVSLGGAVVQLMAINHPARVRALVSVMSTPALRIGRGELGALLSLVRAPVSSAAAAAERMGALYARIGSPDYPPDPAWLRTMGATEFNRHYDPGGTRRQLAAIMTAGDRRPGLSRVAVPTLVLHGARDPVFTVAGGQATAAAVPGAKLVIYPGMGHDLPRPLWPAIVAEVAAVSGLGRR